MSLRTASGAPLSMIARSSSGRDHQQTRLNVWVSGFFGRDNVGDEALLASVLSNSPRWVLPTVLASASAACVQEIHQCRVVQEPPFDYRRGNYGLIHGAGFWLKRGLPYWLSRRRNSAMIVAGGGLLNDHVSGRVVGIRNRIGAISRSGMHVALLGVGVDPMTEEPDRQATKELIDQVSYCSVRDAGSEASLRDIGASPEQFQRGADLAYALPVNMSDTVAQPDHLRGATVGLNLRPLFEFDRERGTDKRARRDQYARACGELVKRLIPLVGELVLVPYNPQDVAFLREVGGRSTRVLDFTPNPYETLARVGRVHIMIGMRYHSLIFAALRRVPFVPLVYGAKTAAFAEELDIAWNELAVGDGTEMVDQSLRPEAVVEHLQQLWESRLAFRNRCEAVVKAKRDVALNDIERCLTTLSQLSRR